MYRKVGKRVFDLIIGVPAIIVLSPVLCVVALLVRLKLGSPILFRQQRPGLRARPFTLLKFRSMIEARDVQDNLLPDADRLTGFGKSLRGTSLDELPELLNVIRGEMSIVGPRPLLMEYLPRYTWEQARRHEIKPGLTGWAQISGRNALTWEKKFAHDLWYVENLSLLVDLRIIAVTVLKVLKREGISEAQHATAREFLGKE
jgi:sugar transferase EpsL